MNIIIRRSVPGDIDLLEHIERAAFPFFQQSPRRTLRLSLTSPFQVVWFAEHKKGTKTTGMGCLVMHLHKHTLRIFSIGVLPEYQGKGVGIKLLKFAENYALAHGFKRISLEADVDNKPLINWYKNAGYFSTELISDYYEEGKDALRLVFELPEVSDNNRLSNLIVVNNPKKWTLHIENAKVVSAKDYTSDAGYFSRKNLRVFNLCNSYRYQSLGYYVSLLASAREHRAIPSIATIRDLKDVPVIKSIAEDIDESIQKGLQKHKGEKFELNVYFGQTVDPVFRQLGQKIYQMFETPLFQVQFMKNSHWEIKKLVPLSIDKISNEDFKDVQLFAEHYFKTKRFKKKRLKHYHYDLAILVNPEEKNPPSDKKALKQFKEAAEEFGFFTEFITREDLERISEFDALFIRATTSVNDYTYQFSRKAYAEGLVVIDDPWSVLKCSNKIYLNERLRNNNLSVPETRVFFKGQVKEAELDSLKYPVILKQPDSAFSMGVMKVLNKEELKAKLEDLFKKSDLVIGQAFLPSEFDWRIGVLDNQALYACKYFMAKGHWQIYDWQSKAKDPSGDAETMAIEEVPRKVIQTAVKAASLMGDGLYGVDLKQVGDKVYVIEVNDNPNIDAGVEDRVMGKGLYRKILQSFLTRIEMSRNIERYVSVEPN